MSKLKAPPSDPQLDPSSGPQTVAPQETCLAPSEISSIIDSFKEKFALERYAFIKKKIEGNTKSLSDVTGGAFKLAKERRNHKILGGDGSVDLLSKRQKDAIDMQYGIGTSNGNNNNSSQEDGYASAVLLGYRIAVKNAVRPIKLPEVEKLPPYTTWVFVHRNQRMTEDQSVVGRRRIYYDKNGGEALICSDTDEEIIEDEEINEDEEIIENEEEKEFAESEDYILRMTIEKAGLSDTVLDALANRFSRKPSEVKARYEDIVKKEDTSKNENTEGTINSYLNKDLDAALDSFDNLFCCRCFVFDCRLHGCAQELIFPAEKQSPWLCADVNKEPCGLNCYLTVIDPESNSKLATLQISNHEETPVPSSKEATAAEIPGSEDVKKRSGKGGSNNRSSKRDPQRVVAGEKRQKKTKVSEPDSFESFGHPVPSCKEAAAAEIPGSEDVKKRSGKDGSNNRSSKRIPQQVVAGEKRQKKTKASESDSYESLGTKYMRLYSRKDNNDVNSSPAKGKSHNARMSNRKECSILDPNNSLSDTAAGLNLIEAANGQPVTSNYRTAKEDKFIDENISTKEVSSDKDWRRFEKDLFEKGLEIFGRSSCLIARNLLNGLRSCLEVFQYMENKPPTQSGDGMNCMLEGNEAPRRSRVLRRKGRRVRRLKYTLKSGGYHSMRKRISMQKEELYPHYTPCNCKPRCGNQCPCVKKMICCEKFCGCTRNCKVRFRGCHCAKDQCRTNFCPCFVARRECDPDLCHYCWVSCGDDYWVPPGKVLNHECQNMKLLLRQQQKILLGRSNVAGWGAFLKNSVAENEFLGEYTGEVISHHEADKRGKIYDLENHSFLFNLNDQLVVDAYRRGDKLKFANHSPDPNCYARIINVGGDHKIAIYSLKPIKAGDEIFYDYRYNPESCPEWSKDLLGPSSKKDEAGPSSGRAKKHT